MVAASTRLRTPSLVRMLETCTVAVLGLMNRVSAIWALVRPIATRASTSCSRAVSPSGSSGDDGFAAAVAAASDPRSSRPRRARASSSARSGAAPSSTVVWCAARSDGSTCSRPTPPSSSASAWRQRAYAVG